MMQDTGSSEVRRMNAILTKEKNMACSKINLPAQYQLIRVTLHSLIALKIIFVTSYHPFIVKDNLIAQMWFEMR